MSATAFQRRRREVEKKNIQNEVPKQEHEVNTALNGLTVPKLKDIAKFEGVEGFSNMTKAELLEALERWNPDEYQTEENGEQDQN